MHDRDVRIAVRRHLDDIHAGDSDTLIVEEMGIWAGSVRVDVAVINGEMHGLELKSARDTLERLPRQAPLYSEVFDKVTLVVALKHIEKATYAVPTWWGIWAVDDDLDEGVTLSALREPSFNPEIQPVQVARLLWRPEAAALLDQYGLLRGFRSKPVETLSVRLAAELPLDILRGEVRSALKRRATWLRKSVNNQRQVTI
jgi:hypothetical protein